MSNLLNEYAAHERKLKFTISNTYPQMSPHMVQAITNIAMNGIIDGMQEVYEKLVEHCAVIEPGAWIRDDIGAMKDELVNNLLK